MNMSLPREILEWVDSERCSVSRQAFIISILFKLKQSPNTFNTEGLINEIFKEREIESSHSRN